LLADTLWQLWIDRSASIRHSCPVQLSKRSQILFKQIASVAS
jgi:hypothetical protein